MAFNKKKNTRNGFGKGVNRINHSKNENTSENVDKYGRATTSNGNYFSGCQFGFDKVKKNSDGKPNFWLNGYRISKAQGVVKINGFENKRSKRYVSPTNNKQHIMLFVECFYENTGNTVVEYIDVCIDSGTAVLEKMNLFMNFAANPKGSITKRVK
jgi:hypothetical protein